MGKRASKGLFPTVSLLAVVLVLSAGCATETGRSTMGGLVYGSMIGTTIAPGIGSAIGAGVGAVAGALEGTQRERETKLNEEAYREKFYRLRDQAQNRHTQAGGQASSRESYDNLVALQERQPLESLIEQSGQPKPTPTQTLSSVGELNSAEGEEPQAIRVAELYGELARLRRERRELESRVNRLSALLEEYDRGGQRSQALVKQMEAALGSEFREPSGYPAGEEMGELHYLRTEYHQARRLKNAALAESIDRRYETISGSKLSRNAVSSY